MTKRLFIAILVVAIAAPLLAGGHKLDSTEGLTVYGASIEVVEHKGKTGVRVLENEQGTEDTIIVIEGSDFHDGTIEVELAGTPRKDAAPNMRGFIGIAFRVDEGPPHTYECIYLRPTNARAPRQIRRNHSTQYVSHPKHPWFRLRKESPGVYESYVDLVADEWTKVRIEVKGTTAKLFVGDAAQPCLIVADLKLGDVSGAVALWIGMGTDGHFRNLVISD